MKKSLAIALGITSLVVGSAAGLFLIGGYFNLLTQLVPALTVLSGSPAVLAAGIIVAALCLVATITFFVISGFSSSAERGKVSIKTNEPSGTTGLKRGGIPEHSAPVPLSQKYALVFVLQKDYSDEIHAKWSTLADKNNGFSSKRYSFRTLESISEKYPMGSEVIDAVKDAVILAMEKRRMTIEDMRMDKTISLYIVPSTSFNLAKDNNYCSFAVSAGLTKDGIKTFSQQLESADQNAPSPGISA